VEGIIPLAFLMETLVGTILLPTHMVQATTVQPTTIQDVAVSDPQQLPQCHTWATQLLLTVYSSIILLFPNSICTDFFY